LTADLEYETTTRAVGFLELAGEGLFRCEGPGAREFLQRLLANDVLGLDVGRGRRSLLLDVKGKVAADLAALRVAESELDLLVPEAARADTLKMLQLYGIADPLETTDASGEAAIFTLQGPRAREGVLALAPAAPALDCELDHAPLTMPGIGTGRVVRHDRTGLGGFDLLVPSASGSQARASLARAVPALGGGELSRATLEVLRIEAGRPTFGADFGTDTIPQEARLEEPAGEALSFEKGCFLGQEVVARLRFRGHVNRLLVGLELPRELESGAKLWKGDKEVGRVTSQARSPRFGRVLGLGYVRRELATPGTELEVESGAERVPVRTAALPFAAVR
jgi:folate-binding protein YgfZ